MSVAVTWATMRTVTADSWQQTRVGWLVPPARPVSTWEGHVSREAKGKTLRLPVPAPAPLKHLPAAPGRCWLAFRQPLGCFSPVCASSVGGVGTLRGDLDVMAAGSTVAAMWTRLLGHSQTPCSPAHVRR